VSSHLSSRPRRLGRQRAEGEAGFTLIEVMVALGLITVLLVAALPVFVNMLRATTVTKSQTQAKNLTQQRLDQLRNLRFHIDRQNGQFLDLLDMYYTNATSSFPVTTVNVGGVPLTGKYVVSTTATGGHPAGAYYQVSTGPLPGYGRFSQTIDTQFLTADGAPVDKAVFENKYDSQVVGKDQSPSLMVGVTIITSWLDSGGAAKSYRVYTRITDGRPQLPVIQSQARALTVDISSSAVDGGTLQLQGGVATVDGAQSSGSSIAGYATGAVAIDGGTTITGKVTQFKLPGQAITTTGTTSPLPGSGCSWYGFGQNDVSNVTGDVVNGLPKAPLDADSGGVLSGFLMNSGNPACGQLSFDNTARGGVERTDPVGTAMGGAPFVMTPDTAGNTPSITGSVYATSTAPSATPMQTTSGARVSMAQPVVIFPGSAETTGTPSTRGLVKVTLTNAAVDCTSGSTPTVTGSYAVRLEWFGRAPTDTAARWHLRTFTYNSAVSATPSASGDAWDPTNTLLSSGLKLSDVVQVSLSGSGLPQVLSQGAQTGLRGFPSGILTVTTASTLVTEFAPGYSAINVVLGKITCVADDLR
jgi:prepilin-type N-terminal cleavage/methylation domain-containing protein